MKTAGPISFVSAVMVAFATLSCDRPTRGTSTEPAVSPPSTTVQSAAPSEPISPLTATMPPSASAGPQTVTVTFDAEPVGAPSPSFEAVVGDWYVSEVAGARGLKVDGSKWRDGTPSANLADQAKRLYGDRYAEFLDGVKAFAFFPFAVWKNDAPLGDIRISLRFYPIAGKIDQAAGIAFAIEPNGTYLGIRANALEDNVLFFRIVRGRRTIIDNIRDVPTPTNTWHTLAVEVRGKQIVATIDGQKCFEKTLDAIPTGKVGVWSKADSQVLFDDFTVEPLVSKGK